MLSESVAAHDSEDAVRALERVLEAFASLGYPREVVTQWSIPQADAVDLVVGLRRDLEGVSAPRILEVGTFVGTSALVMLLTNPRAVVHTVDPNFALEVEFEAMHCVHRDADLARSTQDVAALAAEILGVRDRLILHEGGFSTAVTFAGTARNANAIGGAVIASHGPFDAVFIDGLHFEETVLQDVRLASRAVVPSGTIYLHDAIGYWGSSVRRALHRFLETEPAFTLSHAPFEDLYRSIARVSRIQQASEPFEQRAWRCFGASAARLADCVARSLSAGFPRFDGKAFDVPSEDIVQAMTPAPGAARCGVLLAGVDDLSPEQAKLRLAELCAAVDALVIGSTSVGEIGAAAAGSQPLATRVRQLADLGFDSFDVVMPFLEAFSYALGNGCVLPRSTSFLMNTVVGVRRSSDLHAAVLARGHLPLDILAARSLESARSQQLHAACALRRAQSQGASSRERELELQSQVTDLSTRTAELRESNAELSTRSAHFEARLRYFLDWRIHVGRYHYWKIRG